MFLQEFFDVMGLPIQDMSDLWPEDSVTRLQESAARLTKALQHGYRALVRRRRLIENLRQRIERDEKNVQSLSSCLARQTNAARASHLHHSLMLEEARRSLDRDRSLLQRQKCVYQLLLARVARRKQKLGCLQRKIHDTKIRPRI